MSILKPSPNIQQVRKDKGPLSISPELKAIFAGTAARVENALIVEAADKGLTVTEYVAVRQQEKKEARSASRPSTYRKTVIKTGMIFGDLIIRGKTTPNKGAKPSLRERWRCECRACGNKIVVPKYYLIRKPNPKTHCGCKFETIKSRNPREYRIYMMMHMRCENPKHQSYEHYKKRGITIFPEWHKSHEDGFERFLEHVGPAPSQWHSLDRVRNAEGYYPGNLRWATATQQRQNQGDMVGGFTKEEIAAMGLTEDEVVRKILDGEL